MIPLLIWIIVKDSHLVQKFGDHFAILIKIVIKNINASNQRKVASKDATGETSQCFHLGFGVLLEMNVKEVLVSITNALSVLQMTTAQRLLQVKGFVLRILIVLQDEKMNNV